MWFVDDFGPLTTIILVQNYAKWCCESCYGKSQSKSKQITTTTNQQKSFRDFNQRRLREIKILYAIKKTLIQDRKQKLRFIIEIHNNLLTSKHTMVSTCMNKAHISQKHI